ncbi:MAG: ABC transporter ATP-binding protein [Bacilli bacterium]|nr:ABC transporter ATP-binding protein [Bacilli bacterium]
MKDIKLIFKSIRQYKFYSIFTPLLMIGEVAMEVCMPFVMSLVMDNLEKASTTGNLNIIWPYVIILICMALFSLTCGALAGRFAAIASTGLAKNLRDDIYNKILTFSFKNIDKFSQSSLITRMTTDVSNVQMSFQMMIRIVIRSPLMFIFSIVMAFISGGHIAWIFIALIPLIGFGLIFIFKKAIPIFRRVFKRFDALNQSIKENIDGIRVVKSYVREDYEIEKFNSASDGVANELIRAEKILAFNNPIMMLGINAANLLVCSFGSILIINTASIDSTSNEVIWGALSVGQLSALLTYGVQILMSLMMMSSIFVMMSMAFEGFRRIAEVLREEPDIQNPEAPIYEVMDGSIDFNNVNFKYSQDSEKNALSDIDVHIKSGQFIGVLGSTGSGKTSLINLISRLYDTTEGEVLVGGKNVKEYDLKTLRDNVSVVLQKNVLFSGTIESNLRWGDEFATMEELEKACDIAQASKFIHSNPEGFKRKIEQGGTNVSGGQKQRLCIARAILKKPKILILDDSTSAVDTKTDALIRKRLKESLPNITKIVVAQRISSIEDADQIIVMEDGKINAIGTHDELLATNHIYQEVYETQTKGGKK